MVDFNEFLEIIDKNKDGYFLIENRSGFAYLCVFPPSSQTKAKRVEFHQVVERLNLFQIQYDPDLVKQIVDKADGQWYKIGTWTEPESIDAKFTITITEDFKKAYIEIIPPVYKGKWIQYDDVISELLKKGIKIGIKEDVILKIINKEFKELNEINEEKKEEYTFKYLIAEAIEPIPPVDGRIQFYCNPFPRAKPKELESGKVDFRSLNVIQICNKGDLLAEILPPLSGKNGVDLFANPILSGEGKKAILEAGENTELKDNKLYATISGQIKVNVSLDLNFAKISVAPILEIENVDFSTGNIDFPGTVKIKNRILDGFEVKAKDDIIIEKSVSNVKIISDGEIVLYGGILGRGDSYVFAKGNIFAKFIQNSQVSSNKSIYVEDLILHSEVMAKEEIHIHQGRGEIIGGKIICGKKLIAKRIGSVAEPYTLIFCGIDPQILNQIHAINQDLDKNKKILEEIQKNQKYLETNPEKLKIEKNKQFYEKLILAKEKIQKKVESLNYQKEVLLTSTKNQVEEARVYFKEIIFPNVEIIFGAKNRRYKQTKIPIKRSGYFKYHTEDRIVKFYSD